MKHLKRNMVSILAMLVCCICLGMAGSPMKASAFTEKKITPNKWVKTDSLTDTNKNLYYKITLPSAGYLRLYLTAFMSECRVRIYSENFETCYFEDKVLYASADAPRSLDANGKWLEKGDYYINIWGVPGEFWLKPEYRSARNNEVEPNQTYRQAQALKMNQKVRGLISEQDKSDYYSVTLSKATKITISATAFTKTLRMKVYDSSLQQTDEMSILYATEEAPRSDSWDLNLKAGKYYIYAYGDTGVYTLMVKPTVILAEKVSLNRTSAAIYKGNKLQLKATVKPTDTTKKNVIWTSSNTRVVTVSSNGLVTAKAAGTAKITARTTDGTKLTASCQITVRNKTLAVSPMRVVLVKGKYKVLNVTGKPAVTTKNLTFSTSNSKIVTVTSTGKIIAKRVGTCKVYVKGNGVTKTIPVTVKAK